MVEEIFLQHWIFTKFVFPFLLVFFLIFAILEKTKLFGDDKKQINALTAFIIGLIFVGFAFPKLVIENMILFLTVAIVVVFVGLLLFGFIFGGEVKIGSKGLKWVIGIVIIVVVIIALLWATGIEGGVIDLLFRQDWSNSLWTNVAFVVVIAIALALILKKTSS